MLVDPALVFPRKARLVFFFGHSSTCFSVLEMLFLSVRKLSYHFSRHLIGLPWMFGITCPWSILNLSVILPFWITKHLDFFGLKIIFVHVAIQSSSARTHLACTWVGVITVKSSMNGCWMLTSCSSLRSFWLCTHFRDGQVQSHEVQDGRDGTPYYYPLLHWLPLCCKHSRRELISPK